MANQEIARLGLQATASVTMSRLVDYERQPLMPWMTLSEAMTNRAITASCT
jgi:hypothetical protein